ncbi:hypothetical protein LY78DRAFT_75821 [Colletotrichum sublineola]|uniref:Celp0028 effector like protein n=1 Tax=Colletotrichum sublineola TaxID=1173701 RepID=A0A066X5E9_COLSU|nr:hypothetical protein LY78DRAFT_75821 [Colletotrichum sublineola]KDN60981.1 hypothetical protein CSUB01_01118 [Colletotrichum sublineola]
MVLPARVSLLGLAVAAVFASPLQPRELAVDEVVLLNHDGTTRIMKAADLEALETPAAAPAPASFPVHNVTTTPGMVRRGCEKSTEVQVLSDEHFIDWDVPMSPLVSSGGGNATVSIMDGFRLSDRLRISAHTEVRKALRVSTIPAVDMTWTTTQTNTLRFTLPPNKYGLVVSQPYVRRVQGNVLSGCTDNPDRNPFESDTYESQNFGRLSWVKGIIRMCTSETYPVPYCIGNGSHA